MAEFALSPSVRPSPYFEAAIADGAISVAPYNQMLLPASYGDPEAEYRRLVEGVSMWDVGAERQVELVGPDAANLAQILCPRDLSTCVEGQGKYVALCDHAGTLINDPIILKIAADRYWLSIADSDVAMWARCVAAERGLDVAVNKPDVSPLAVQGPKAVDVVASIFGDWIRDLKYFWFGDAEIDGIPLKVARSGWSKQGGFELYLMDGTRGQDLWNLVKEAGAPWGIGPGSPNPSERIESGLLSWGGDTDDRTNPFEVRLGRFVDLDVPDDVIGIDALRRIAADGPARHQLGVVLVGRQPTTPHHRWFDIVVDDAKIGDLTNGAWSYLLERMIGFGLVSVDARPGDRVQVDMHGEMVDAMLCDIPFKPQDRF